MNTVDQIVQALGPPQTLRAVDVSAGSHSQALVARWRHSGGFVDRRHADAYQLVFNISSGQTVEIRAKSGIVRQSITAGSVALICPGDTASVEIFGTADTLHCFVTRELIQSIAGCSPSTVVLDVARSKPRLQAAAAQVLVALSQAGPRTMPLLIESVTSIASHFSEPAMVTGSPAMGGLSPAARRRVHALIDNRVTRVASGGLSIPDLADAAGLSVHHFIKAFRTSEGQTPHARVLQHRIEQALPLLLQGNHRIDRIADETGFSSASHFVSMFRNRVGVTPGALRDAARSLD